MRNTILIFFNILILSLLTSCGADKLKPAQTSGVSPITTQAANSCSCVTNHSPVCGSDNKDYDNECVASCFKITTNTPGHCDCNQNKIAVCGSDGLDHTECEAREQKIEIVKYIPCAATGI